MRRASFALSAVFLVSIHARAADPGSASPPPKTQPGPAPKVAPAPAPARAGDAPPPEFYVEPPPLEGRPPASAPPAAAPAEPPPGSPPPPPSDDNRVRVFEPPPPGFYPPGEPVFEPPPPPEPHHVAPRTSLWLGARLGWFVPFGNLWARCANCVGGAAANGQYLSLKGVPWSDYASSGPMFELDAGARLSRSYNVFALWERAQLGSGSGDPDSTIAGHATRGNTDFWGVGVRATSDPDRIGFTTELAIGYRRARSTWSDGTQIQLTDAPFEARLGLGADIRLNRYVSLSPMFTVGVGSFGKVERVSKGTVSDETGSLDQADGHAWVALTFGGSFDLLGSRR